MASMYKYHGRWIVESNRKKIRCGTNKATANQVHIHVEQLEQSIKYDTTIPDATIAWLRGVDQILRDRLAAIGLIPGFKHRTISDLTEAFKQSKTRLSTNNTQTINGLKEYFGESALIKDITSIDAKHFKKWLLTEARKCPKPKNKSDKRGIAQSTAAGRIKNARQMFKMAVKAKWIPDNPFEQIVAGKQNNPDREFYVKPELAQQILDELPSVELRLIFALGRWAGFRLPSEAYDLRWADINWERSSMTFRSRKTKHIQGHETRTCPIFAELRPYLDAAWDALDGDPAEFCCPWLRSAEAPGQSFTTQLNTTLKRLGIEPWPKLLNNLRATRATEVADQFGLKAESRWIGHGPSVAMAHYLMVTDEKWARAVKSTKQAANSENLSSEKLN